MTESFILLFLLLGWFLYAVLKPRKLPEEVKEAAEKEEKKLEDEITTAEEKLTLSLKDHDNPTVVFFIKAMLKNFRYLRTARYMAGRISFLSSDNDYRVMAERLIIRTKKYLKGMGSPKYSDCSTLATEAELKHYAALSEAYSRLHIALPENENNYGADLGYDSFFYVRAGKDKIPVFVIGEDKKEFLYIYPTIAIKYDSDFSIEFSDLTSMQVTATKIAHSETPTSLLKIEPFGIEILTKKVKAAEDFHKAFVEIQTYINSSEWGLNDDSGKESKKDAEIRKVLDRMNNLIGQLSVKEELKKIANFVKIQQIRKMNGMKTASSSYHCVFTGNPGTGKTTIARMLADIYKELGVVTTGQLVETDRSGLVGEYVGQTAVKTNEVIDKALEGVLFIDEAYSLAQGGNNDFGAEAISTLLKRMEDDRDQLVVILAGYGEEMKGFIDSNPGLESRFNRYIHFEDYSAEELLTIFKKMLSDNDYRMSDGAEKKLCTVINQKVESKDRNFGNARYVRNLFEKTCQLQSSRLSASREMSKESLELIEADDIPEKVK